MDRVTGASPCLPSKDRPRVYVPPKKFDLRRPLKGYSHARGNGEVEVCLPSHWSQREPKVESITTQEVVSTTETYGCSINVKLGIVLPKETSNRGSQADGAWVSGAII